MPILNMVCGNSGIGNMKIFTGDAIPTGAIDYDLWIKEQIDIKHIICDYDSNKVVQDKTLFLRLSKTPNSSYIKYIVNPMKRSNFIDIYSYLETALFYEAGVFKVVNIKIYIDGVWEFLNGTISLSQDEVYVRSMYDSQCAIKFDSNGILKEMNTVRGSRNPNEMLFSDNEGRFYIWSYVGSMYYLICIDKNNKIILNISSSTLTSKGLNCPFAIDPCGFLYSWTSEGSSTGIISKFDKDLNIIYKIKVSATTSMMSLFQNKCIFDKEFMYVLYFDTINNTQTSKITKIKYGTGEIIKTIEYKLGTGLSTWQMGLANNSLLGFYLTSDTSTGTTQYYFKMISFSVSDLTQSEKLFEVDSTCVTYGVQPLCRPSRLNSKFVYVFCNKILTIDLEKNVINRVIDPKLIIKNAYVTENDNFYIIDQNNVIYFFDTLGNLKWSKQGCGSNQILAVYNGTALNLV